MGKYFIADNKRTVSRQSDLVYTLYITQKKRAWSEKKTRTRKKIAKAPGSEGTKVPMANNITTDQKDSNTQFVPYHCAGKQITITAVLCMAEG